MMITNINVRVEVDNHDQAMALGKMLLKVAREDFGADDATAVAKTELKGYDGGATVTYVQTVPVVGYGDGTGEL